MAATLDQNGLKIETLSTIVANLNVALKAIYGNDINLDPNSPDGQLVALIAQAKVDVEELLANVYASMDPDQAIGVVLDQRCAINGVVRQAGTNTLQTVTITVDQALTLAGLDTAPTAPFTVADSTGNKYELITTHVFSAAGSADLGFQAALLGPIASAANTIQTLVTILLGVTGANNPDAPTSVGLSEETDSALRIRRENSVSLPSKGYLAGLLGALQDVAGVVQAEVFENMTSDDPDSQGIPAHSIWAIVLGGSNADIARAIYVKRPMGCGMKGSVVVPLMQVDSTTFDVAFDRPTQEDLWIELTITAITGAVDVEFIRSQILANISYRIDQTADASAIVAFVKGIAPNASVSGEGVSSDGSTYAATLAPTGVNYQFVLSSAKLIINGEDY